MRAIPTYLRDTLLCLAETGLFRPQWSPDILIELQRNLVEDGIPEAAVIRTIAAMTTHFDDALAAGYEHLISAMTRDDKDRHVLAAAVHARAEALVTFNVRDFPTESVAPYQISLLKPDDLLLDLLDLAPGLVIRTVTAQAARHKREPKTVAGLLTALARGGAPRFVDETRRLLA